jgi:carbon-monoxide dehydrogenase large subunit
MSNGVTNKIERDDSFTSLGKSTLRKEDYRLLTGSAQYTDDIPISHALHACFTRSPYAHARIKSIDTSKALSVPGVVTVVTGKDLAKWTNTARISPPIEGLQPMEMTTLPIDKVRFDGDPVVCVVAVNRYIAEDAAELVEVEYEVLPPVVNASEGLKQDAALVDDRLSSNLLSHQKMEHGDVRKAFSKADRIVEASFTQHRQTHVPMETRGCAAVWDPGRQYLTLYIGVQTPHPVRTQVADRLGLKESQVQIVSKDIGGAFGQKLVAYREDITIAALARELKRPIRWREDRMENLLSALQAREDTVKTRAAVTKEGEILALEAEITSDFGAYSYFPGNYMARVIGMILPGPYKIRDYAYEMKIVLTNKCPAGPYRAPMAITSWVMEGTIDKIARELDLDPVKIRMINMLKKEDLPYLSATEELYEDISPSECLDVALHKFDISSFRERQKIDWISGKYRGLGICTVVEPTTYGSGFYLKAGIQGSGHEAAWVRIEPTGVVNASVGIMGSGQGYETTLAQAVAEGLGVDLEQVQIHLGDTLVAPYGMGSRGARGAVAGGGTAYLTAVDARKKVLAIAAHLLGIEDSTDLKLENSAVYRRSAGEWIITDLLLKDIARIAYLNPLELPSGMEPGLEFHKTYDPPAMTYSNCVHLCEVEVDSETGRIDIGRYLIVEDAGTLINPQIVEGQIHGATALGIGGVLFEEVIYDHTGQNVTGTFMDYLLPTACETPSNMEIYHIETKNQKTPAGMKGMSEGGVMGAIGAVCNAVSDALKPFDIFIEKQPLSPNYIHDLIKSRRNDK